VQGLCLEVSAIESSLSLKGVFGEEVQKKLVRPLALAAGRFEQAAQHAVVL
jgi:hypothetical protein